LPRTLYELRKAESAGKIMIPVPPFDLKFVRCAGGILVGKFKSAALAGDDAVLPVSDAVMWVPWGPQLSSCRRRRVDSSNVNAG
jgi:hypothetical protein